jgi:Fe2+ transport system protein B
MHLNDNVFKNLDKFSVLSFDKELKYHKKEFTKEEKTVIVDKFLSDNKNDKEQLSSSLDRILITHRNTKLFLFMMSGPFFVMFSLLKYFIKFFIFYKLFKKGKSKTSEMVEEAFEKDEKLKEKVE